MYNPAHPGSLWHASRKRRPEIELFERVA